LAFAPRRTICRGMIRSLCIIGLGAPALLAGLAAQPWQAQAQERRFFQVAPGPRNNPPRLDTTLGAAGASAVTVMDPSTIARWLCPNGGRPTRGRPGRCDGRGSARGGGGTGTGTESEVAGWHADLPPPTHRQLACPAGTVAAEARFNPGTVRCMPLEIREATARPVLPSPAAVLPLQPDSPAVPAPSPVAAAPAVPSGVPAVSSLPVAPAVPEPAIASPAVSPVPSALSRMVAESTDGAAPRPRGPHTELVRRAAPASTDGS
jgi:hypothetical protein